MEVSAHRRPFPLRGLLVGSAVVVVAAALLSRIPTIDLSRYFAGLPAPLAAALACGLGVLGLYVLHRDFRVWVVRPSAGARSSLVAAGLAIPFMLAVTIADLVWRFPDDINVPLPAALLFYPTMGVIAETALHVAPFALVMAALGRLAVAWPLKRRVAIAALVAAVPEALFQVDGSSAEPLQVFVALQLFAFGVVEIALLDRFDLPRMLVFRLTYYAYWHMIWGTLRL